MSPAENTPNFDSMTPEEIMAWMESLAKRQGATEGFTTNADMEIPVLDPDSVVIDEPGYVPSEGKSKGKTGPLNAPRPVEKPAAPPPTVPQPVAATPSRFVEPIASPPVVQPSVSQPEPEVAAASLSWLESLAADQGGSFAELDLSSLASELTPMAETPATPAASPIDWLESLVQDTAPAPTPVQSVASGPEDMSDPLLWLESLAKRQGANAEELITSASLEIPLPDSVEDTGPGYSDYSFESPLGETRVEISPPVTPVVPAAPAPMQDPAAWLDSLASAQKVDTSTSHIIEPEAEEVGQLTDAEIQQALARGEFVPADQMGAWMNRQLEIGAQRQEPPELAAYDPDAPAVRAEIPDWLIEQVGQPVTEDSSTKPVTETPPLTEAILEPPPVQDMPDWLKVDLPADSELDSIFAPVVEDKAAEPVAAQDRPQATYSPGPAIQIDEHDPWVEALDLEYRQKHGEASTDELPVWYEKKTATEERPTVPVDSTTPAMELQDAALQPESQLPAGKPEPIPDWLKSVLSEEELSGEAEAVPEWLETEVVSASAAIAVPDIQDWMDTTDIEPAEIPAWLTEAIGGQPQRLDTVSTPEASVPVAPPVAPAASTALAPARMLPPIQVQTAAIDVAATLSSARAHATSNDIDACLVSYEQLIRANAELDAVTVDLTTLSDKIKTSSALYRVLGDSLMRQGKLQSALDTYRKALNQL